MNKFWYFLMLISFFMLSIQGPTLKDKVVGVLIFGVNALIFWR